MSAILPVHQKILALAAANPGLTQQEIADAVGRSTKTVQRALQSNSDFINEAQVALLAQLATHIQALHSSEDSALNYVELATSAKNEAVRLGAQQRIDDLLGIVTEKERIRAKTQAPAEPQPMFVLPSGCNVAVTFNQQNNTIQRTDTQDVVNETQEEVSVIRHDASRLEP